MCYTFFRRNSPIFINVRRRLHSWNVDHDRNDRKNSKKFEPDGTRTVPVIAIRMTVVITKTGVGVGESNSPLHFCTRKII